MAPGLALHPQAVEAVLVAAGVDFVLGVGFGEVGKAAAVGPGARSRQTALLPAAMSQVMSYEKNRQLPIIIFR